MVEDEFKVPLPCHEDWRKMRKVEQGRFCESCHCKVHDISRMTATEARELVASPESVCIRVTKDRKGRVIHRHDGSTNVTALGVLASLITLVVVTFPIFAPTR